MKKIIALLLAVIMCLGILAGCKDEKAGTGGKNDASDTGTENKDTADDGENKQPTSGTDAKDPDKTDKNDPPASGPDDKTPEDNADFEKLTEKMETLESVSVKLDASIKISAEGVTVEMPITMGIKAKDIKGDDPVVYMNMDMSIIGQKMSMEMYQEDGWQYCVENGEKYKEKVSEDSEDENDTSKIGALLDKLPDDIEAEPTVNTNSDGSVTMSVVLKASELGALLDELKSMIGDSVADVTFNDATVSITAKDGYLIACECTMEINMLLEGVKTGGSLKITATLEEPGKPVEITPPEGYKDFPEQAEVNDDGIYNPEAIAAEFGQHKLTNEQLTYFYYNEYYYMVDLMNSYGMALFDTSKPLSQQEYEGGKTWEDYFVDSALTTWQETVVLYDAAKKADYVLPDDIRKDLDELVASMDPIAVSNGYKNADEYLKVIFGDYATAKGYVAYLEMSEYSGSYYYDTFDKVYAQHLYNLEGLESFNVNIRHILFMPSDSNSDTSWAEAEKKANDIYGQWKNGEATEASFSELAKTHSEDGSASVGGLYEDVYQGRMVEAFDAWCFDESRKAGDHGIVKTEYGYHIMYFVAHVNPNAYTIAQETVDSMVKSAKENVTLTTHPDVLNIKNPEM